MKKSLIEKISSFLCKHNFQTPVSLTITELLNGNEYLIRTGQRLYCKRCFHYKDVFNENKTHSSKDAKALEKMISFLYCMGSHHEFKNPIVLTEFLNETSHVVRKGQRFFCTNCGLHKDVFNEKL